MRSIAISDRASHLKFYSYCWRMTEHVV
jgi:hypothetical protein